jgi:hypothetical protein
MNDVDAGVPGGVWQPANDDVPRPARGHVQREQAFQLQAVLFMDRVILPPYWLTAICHENELSDNARARARARGVQPGVPDLYVAQAPASSGAPRTLWLELKWGKNQPSDAQRHVQLQLTSCLVPHAFCWTMQQVLVALHHAGIRLHENARNLADEYQHRAEAAVLKAEQRPTRTGTTRKRTGKPSLRALRMAATRLGL